jgi:threonine aldolase
MNERSFASDNGAGIHPQVLAAIAASNHGHASAYGNDPWTTKACDVLREAFGGRAQALLCFGGTGANVIALATVTRRYDAILCANSAHIVNSECAAVEHYCGGKLLPIASVDGKLTPALLEPALAATRGVHHARPRVVSITQPTEWGTLYSVAELRALCDFAHERKLSVHVDGARLANAAAALDVSLAALSAEVGIDVLSFGGTKNGLLGAEAVIVFDAALAEEAAYARKQTTQLASKMRFQAAQFLAYMDDELWRTLATQANTMATRLATALRDVEGLEFVCPVETNMLFPRLPRAVLTALQRDFHFYTWREQDAVARWVTSFDTSVEDVDGFAAAVTSALRARV